MILILNIMKSCCSWLMGITHNIRLGTCWLWEGFLKLGLLSEIGSNGNVWILQRVLDDLVDQIIMPANPMF
jgi:hypothetical protein